MTLFHSIRGVPAIDPEKCMGCGACVSKCPTDSLTLHRTRDSILLELNVARCIRCAYCAEACPNNAITIEDKYTAIGRSREELVIRVRVPLARCDSCGEPLRHSVREVELAREKVPDLNVIKLCDKCKVKRVLAR